MPVFIIEHMEPRVWKWCYLEYKHISTIVGKENLWFTNVKTGKAQLRRLGKVFSKSVTEMNLENPVILDADANKTLTPKEAKKFSHIIFGGILGDYPPRGRTKDLRIKMPGVEARNMGKEQMSTDTAVLVAYTILSGMPLHKIRFTHHVDIDVREGESVTLPYKYVLKDGKPVLAPGLVEMLRRQKGF
ncbi:MAG: SAM-dependent methyltransferase [Candidatus Woesearchaeota archaeon]